MISLTEGMVGRVAVGEYRKNAAGREVLIPFRGLLTGVYEDGLVGTVRADDDGEELIVFANEVEEIA